MRRLWEDWRRIGGRLEGSSRTGGGLEEDWRRTRGRLEGSEEDWRRSEGLFTLISWNFIDVHGFSFIRCSKLLKIAKSAEIRENPRSVVPFENAWKFAF